MGASEKKVYNARSKQLTGDIAGQNQTLQQNGTQSYNQIQPALNQYTDLAKSFTSPDRFAKSSENLDQNLLDYTGRVSGMFNNAGYSPEEKAGMKFATSAPIAGAFAGADAGNTRQAAVTNNPNAAVAQRGVLARDRARMTSEGMAGLQKSFGDARISGQQNALQDSQFVPQMNMQQMQGERSMLPAFQFPATLNADMYNQSNQNINANNNTQANVLGQQSQMAINPGFWSKLALTAAGNVNMNLNKAIN